MPRGIRKKARQYVLDRFQEEDPESYFKYKMHTGLNQEQMELLQAIRNQSLQVVKSHLNKGVDPNFTMVPEKTTPLHIAVRHFAPQNPASEKILRVLLFFGADTEAADLHGNTALHEACRFHSVEGVELLIQAGADLNIINNVEETPLMVTCRCPQAPSLPIARLLLAAGAIPIVANIDGQTALHILSSSVAVAREPSLETVRHKMALLLMEHGLRADEEDESGKTPLSYEILHMERCSRNASLSLELMKGGLNSRVITNTAICLVQGGAMHVSVHTREMETLIHTIPVQGHSLSILHSFLWSVRNFLSPALWKRLNKMVGSVSQRSTQVAEMQNAVGLLNSEVRSLAHLAKISIRTSLQGGVIQRVQLLKVPEKIKTFIVSED